MKQMTSVDILITSSTIHRHLDINHTHMHTHTYTHMHMVHIIHTHMHACTHTHACTHMHTYTHNCKDLVITSCLLSLNSTDLNNNNCFIVSDRPIHFV